MLGTGPKAVHTGHDFCLWATSPALSQTLNPCNCSGYKFPQNSFPYPSNPLAFPMHFSFCSHSFGWFSIICNQSWGQKFLLKKLCSLILYCHKYLGQDLNLILNHVLVTFLLAWSKTMTTSSVERKRLFDLVFQRDKRPLWQGAMTSSGRHAAGAGSRELKSSNTNTKRWANKR